MYLWNTFLLMYLCTTYLWTTYNLPPTILCTSVHPTILCTSVLPSYVPMKYLPSYVRLYYQTTYELPTILCTSVISTYLCTTYELPTILCTCELPTTATECILNHLRGRPINRRWLWTILGYLYLIGAETFRPSMTAAVRPEANLINIIRSEVTSLGS